MGERTLGTKLRPLVQLVPAAVVAAVILITLPSTRPVLAEVPERLSAVIEASREEPESAPAEEEEEDLLPTLPYEDGVYTGSSRGYGGPVKVQVTMEGGHITDVRILDASHETSNFLRRSKRLLNTVVTEQTWEVDAVSEATYTSRGILGAVQNALTGEEVINPAPPKQKEPEPLVVEEFTPPDSPYRDGIYTASAEGFGGPITVQVTISDGAIADITIVDHAKETTSYFSRARAVIPAILESGSPDVDSISGATYSSTGILNAVKLALTTASSDPAQPTEELPAESEPAEEVPESQPEEPAPSEEPAASEEAPAEPEAEPQDKLSDFFAQVKDTLTSLFAEDEEEASASSAPAVVFRAPDPAASSVAEEAPTTEAASDGSIPTETEAASE